MTLQEVDNAIASWNSRLSAAAQNLVDLQSLPVYQRLAGTNGVPQAQLTGETAQIVRPALATISRLLLYFDLLQHTVIRAEELREDMPVFSAEARIREIEQVLLTPSIHLPSEPVPLDRRSLLSSVNNVECIAPEDLIRLMAQAFEQVKSVVLMVDAAWERLGRKIEQALAAVELLKPEGGEDSHADLTGVADAAERARQQAETDPLAAAAVFENAADPALNRVATRIEENKQLRREIETGLAVANALLESLHKIHAEAVTLHAEAVAKVSTASPLPGPADQGTVTALDEWLRRLEIKYRQGTLKPIVTGIRNWNKAAEQCVSSERRVLLANRAPLELRAELRGRMDALKAKARARGVSEEDELTRLAEECSTLLDGRPASLDRAATAVEAYEKHLSAIA